MIQPSFLYLSKGNEIKIPVPRVQGSITHSRPRMEAA